VGLERDRIVERLHHQEDDRAPPPVPRPQRLQGTPGVAQGLRQQLQRAREPGAAADTGTRRDEDVLEDRQPRRAPQAEPGQPVEVADVPGRAREVFVAKAAARLEQCDAVALLGQAQRRDAAAEPGADDDPVEVEAGRCGVHAGFSRERGSPAPATSDRGSRRAARRRARPVRTAGPSGSRSSWLGETPPARRPAGPASGCCRRRRPGSACGHPPSSVRRGAGSACSGRCRRAPNRRRRPAAPPPWRSAARSARCRAGAWRNPARAGRATT